MAKYKAKHRGYDGHRVIEAGEVFDFSGKPGRWMEALDKKAAVEADEAFKEAQYEEKAQAPGPAPKKALKKD